MCVNRTTIAYLRVLIIEIRSTIILMVVEAQGWNGLFYFRFFWANRQFPRTSDPFLFFFTCRLLRGRWATKKKGPWLVGLCRGWNPTQLHRDVNKPLQGSLLTNQDSMESRRAFFVAQVFMTHRIHGTDIFFLLIYHKNQPFMEANIPNPMDPSRVRKYTTWQKNDITTSAPLKLAGLGYWHVVLRGCLGLLWV